MSTLWTFGDSFTAEYYPVGLTPPNFYDKYKDFLCGELPPVWPTLLANKLNFNIENKGVGASSNYSIFYRFCQNIENFNENDIIIFQWASPYRFVMANDQDNVLQDVVPSASYEFVEQKIIDTILVNRSSEIWFKEILYWTLIIDEICKLKNIKLFYWSFSEEILVFLQNNFKKYDKNKYIRSRVQPLYYTLCKLANEKATIIQETDNQIQDGHFGQYGHITQADYFFNFINRRL